MSVLPEGSEVKTNSTGNRDMLNSLGQLTSLATYGRK